MDLQMDLKNCTYNEIFEEYYHGMLFDIFTDLKQDNNILFNNINYKKMHNFYNLLKNNINITDTIKNNIFNTIDSNVLDKLDETENELMY